MKKTNDNLLSTDNMQALDLLNFPDYVESNPIMKSDFLQYGVFPWLDNNNIPRAYVANTHKDGFEIISDFYIEPLLHIYGSIYNRPNERTIMIRHLNPKLDRESAYLDHAFYNLGKFTDFIMNVGPYNFSGSKSHFEKIKRQISYGFTPCTPLY